MNEYERLTEERIRAEHQAELDRAEVAKQEGAEKKQNLDAFAKHFTAAVEPLLQNHLAKHPLAGGMKPKIKPYSCSSIPNEAWLIIEATAHYDVSYGPWKVRPQQSQADVTKYTFDSSGTAKPFQMRGALLTSKNTPEFETLDEAMADAYYRDKKYMTNIIENFNLNER
jgi:hypothetical protein